MVWKICSSYDSFFTHTERYTKFKLCEAIFFLGNDLKDNCSRAKNRQTERLRIVLSGANSRLLFPPQFSKCMGATALTFFEKAGQYS